mmetsp:Transcript_6535/g.15087  ORF Transcript_6535/g.15087 Transcript_6535/m.15087 type:complete len:242 (+) Transcript_6535:557-1282(+)
MPPQWPRGFLAHLPPHLRSHLLPLPRSHHHCKHFPRLHNHPHKQSPLPARSRRFVPLWHCLQHHSPRSQNMSRFAQGSCRLNRGLKPDCSSRFPASSVAALSAQLTRAPCVPPPLQTAVVRALPVRCPLRLDLSPCHHLLQTRIPSTCLFLAAQALSRLEWLELESSARFDRHSPTPFLPPPVRCASALASWTCPGPHPLHLPAPVLWERCFHQEVEEMVPQPSCALAFENEAAGWVQVVS